MTCATTIESSIYEHVLGSASPVQCLLDTGVLPESWVSDYLALVTRAEEQWSQSPVLPRQLVAALHFASWYLELRYRAWATLNANAQNPHTEARLIRVRRASEPLLLSPATRKPKVA